MAAGAANPTARENDDLISPPSTEPTAPASPLQTLASARRHDQTTPILQLPSEAFGSPGLGKQRETPPSPPTQATGSVFHFTEWEEFRRFHWWHHLQDSNRAQTSNPNVPPQLLHRAVSAQHLNPSQAGPLTSRTISEAQPVSFPCRQYPDG